MVDPVGFRHQQYRTGQRDFSACQHRRSLCPGSGIERFFVCSPFTVEYRESREADAKPFLSSVYREIFRSVFV
jgi:hypothetical protein